MNLNIQHFLIKESIFIKTLEINNQQKNVLFIKLLLII